MFNNWLNLKHSLNATWRKNRNLFIYFRNYNFRSLCNILIKKSFRYNFFHYRNDCIIHHKLCNPSNKNYYKYGEKTSRFFSDYADHSIKIASYIKKGYGINNQEFLGSVNGFEIKYPKEPQIKNIGKAKIHLEKDYPSIWILKNRVKEISKDHLNLINTVINQNFRRRIRQILSNFRQNNYPDEIFDEVLKEIQNNMNEERRKLKIKQSSNTFFFEGYFESDRNIPIINTNYDYNRINEVHNEFNQIINSLINDNELIALVTEYNRECYDFYNNDERNEFFNQINQLYNNIVYENQTMPQKGRCGSKKCITRLTKLRNVFPC